MTAPVRRREKRQEVMQRNTSEGARPGDGFLAEVSRRAALTAHQQKAGETTMVGRAATRDDGWRIHAACRASDPEIFFPVAENGPEHDQAVEQAKQVCAGCPVRAECAAWAIQALPYGVAGGLSADERHRARHGQTVRRAPARSHVPAPRAVVARRPSRTRSRRIEDGQAALANGVGRDQVAAEFGVTRRTVDRWAAERADTVATKPVGAVVVSGGGR